MELNNIKENAKLLVKDWLENIFAKMEILENENLVEKGLSSIQVMQLSGKLKKAGVKISFAKLMEDPNLSNWYQLIDESKIKIKKDAENLISKSDSKQFVLTDVQYSYLIGRENDQILGGVGCHAYLEIDGENIEADRLKTAWNKLQYRHPMLRAKFTKDGYQEILDKPYSEEIEVFDLSALDEETLHSRLMGIREQISHRKLNVNEGEVAGLSLAKFSNEKSRIFFDVDLLVSDVMSMSIIIKELAELYSGVELDHLDVYTFKEYMQNIASNPDNEEDKAFWEQKINSFEIERPNLPLKKQPEQIKETKFTRRKRIIKKEEWETIKDIAASYQSTPSMVLLTAYALVLERWCNQEKFFINIPLFNRDLENKYLKDMVSDFTNILLVEHEVTDDSRFLDTLRRINKTFLENVSHSAYSGVQVQRDISKNQGTSVNIAPVVFACNIDYPLETEISRKNLGKVSYMISQTPGVWLDFQTYIIDGNLILCWDSVDELFPKCLLDDMMDSLYGLLESLRQKINWEKKVDVLPENQKSIRKQDVEEILPLQYPDETLYDGFIKNVKLNPDKVAIIDSETKEQITYYKLYEISLKVAGYLSKNGIEKGNYVGITLPRGSRQLYAIFGILFVGATYVSIGIAQPNDRRSKIYNQIGIKHIISDEKTIKNCILSKDEVEIIDLDEAMANESKLEQPVEISLYDSAYIIMTSGTTGIPKGVEIMHTSAINTCIDLNEKYKVSADDTILMVSAIDFDLSVYDIFAILNAGGTIVTTSEDNYRNPDEWLKLVDEYNVTIWDSVPILFDMIVTMGEGKNRKLPFRLVMLSGDWIAINLPERFYCISENADSVVVAMGGATEASIWSNYLNVPREIPKDWISIPYGRPLKNQVYRVVDDFGRICPNYVKGELLIGGVGVAKCYHGDEELTKKKYFEKDGVRWYKTGDNGRTWNDGTIEFLGRKDTQVKVKGHRIELGEIEDAIRRYKGVDRAIVDFIEKENGKQLVAFIKINNDYSEISGDVRQSEMKDSFIVTPKNTSKNEILAQNKEINNVVIKTILEVLNNIGVDFGKNTFSLDEIYKKISDSEERIFIVKHWIDTLLSYGILRSIGNKYEFISNNFDIEINDKSMRKICEYTTNLATELTDILTGNKEAIEVFYAEDNKFSINKLCENLIGYEESIESILLSLKNITTLNPNKKLRILEFSTRNKKITELLFNELKDYVEEYIYLDNSIYYKDRLSTLQKYENFKYIVVEKEISEKFENDYFDAIIALNSIHRSINSQDQVYDFINVLKAGGLLIGNEINKCNLLPIITADVIENKDFLDKKEINFIADNSEIMYESNFHSPYVTNFNTFALRKLRNSKITFNEIEYYLREEIPAYMIPTYFYNVDNIPLNKNGKVDRKKLKSRIKIKKSNYINNKNNREEAKTKLEEILLDIWKDVLNKELSVKDNYFFIGGDSLTATVIIGKIKKKMHIEISIKDIFQNPSVDNLAKFINKNYKKILIAEEESKKIIPDTKHLYEPFPLTDVQMAYWIGRQGAYKLGNVSTHCYFEFDYSDLDVPKLQKVLNDSVNYHPALRTIVSKTGEQQILLKYPHLLIEMNDISLLSKEDRKEVLQQIREDLSHKIIDLSKFPTFDFKVIKFDKNLYRIFIGLDNTILDGWSMFNFLSEIKSRYDDKYEEENIKISFRDYVLYKNKIDNANLKKDKNYWMSRKDKFLEAPMFEGMKNEDDIKQQKFVRREDYIDHGNWTVLKEIAQNCNITPTILLVTVFSDVIRKYSLNREFSLNITQFDREQIHQDINKIIGDFTSLIYLEVKSNYGDTLIDVARKLQKQLTEDMEHKSYSAIEFGRELRVKNNSENSAVMPIVFTSGLGIVGYENNNWLGNLVYNISQTPQIWLDHQVMEENGKLKLIWDSIDEIFPNNLLDKMFKDYIEYLNFLAKNKSFNNKISYLVEDTEKSSNSIIVDNKKCQIICNKETKNVLVSENYDDIMAQIIIIWSSKFQFKKIGPESDFFENGGDSLKAVELINSYRDVFNIEVPLNMVFNLSTVKEQCVFIKEVLRKKDINNIFKL